MKYIFLEMVADYLSKNHQGLFMDIVEKVSIDLPKGDIIFSKEDIIEAENFLRAMGINPKRDFIGQSCS